MGWLEEMNIWSMMDEKEIWKNFLDDGESEDDVFFLQRKESFILSSKLRKKKKNIDEEIGYYYNVSTYRILPYPPNTKDIKDFFIQRT
jgi:AAA15 family ATPase/GTPase